MTMVLERARVGRLCLLGGIAAAAALARCGGGASGGDATSDAGDGGPKGGTDGSTLPADAISGADDARAPDGGRAEDATTGDAGSGSVDSAGGSSDASSGSSSDSPIGSPSDAPSGDGAGATWGSCDTVHVDGSACPSLGLTSVPSICVPGATPAPQGGTIENGTYAATSATTYGCDSGASTAGGATWSVCGNRWDELGMTFAATYQGTSVTLTPTCGGGSPRMLEYTATPQHLILYEQFGLVWDHTKL